MLEEQRLEPASRARQLDEASLVPTDIRFSGQIVALFTSPRGPFRLPPLRSLDDRRRKRRQRKQPGLSRGPQECCCSFLSANCPKCAVFCEFESTDPRSDWIIMDYLCFRDPISCDRLRIAVEYKDRAFDIVHLLKFEIFTCEIETTQERK